MAEKDNHDVYHEIKAEVGPDADGTEVEVIEELELPEDGTPILKPETEPAAAVYTPSTYVMTNEPIINPLNIQLGTGRRENDRIESFPDQIQKSSSKTIANTSLQPQMLDSDVFSSRLLYSKDEIGDAKFTKFSRFTKVLDPYGRINPGREFLFFVKPDLHIAKTLNADVYRLTKGAYAGTTKFGNITLNPQLNFDMYFHDLIRTHPKLIGELQYSSEEGCVDPFCHLLSFYVKSNLPLDSSNARTMDNPATIFGTNYNYLQDSEASDEAYSFSLEFDDDKELNVYHFFKAYSQYHIARKSGMVTPPAMKYYTQKRLHNTMGIYKFIVAEDMETILYYAYLWGVIPTSCPREAFQDANFTEGLSFTVNFEAAFIEDMNPRILRDFNKLMLRKSRNKINPDDWLPIVKRTTIPGSVVGEAYDGFIDGRLPSGALVDSAIINNEIVPKYRLRWYA